MADKQQLGSGFTINSADNYVLGNASEGVVGRFVIQAVSSSFSGGSITVRGRVKGAGANWVAIPYKKRNIGGTVGDDSTVSAALTGGFIIDVDAAGLDVSLDNASYTSGSLTVYYQGMQG